MPILMEERIQKYKTWLERKPVDRPMVGLLWEPDIPPLPNMLDQVGIGNELRPGDIAPEMFLSHIEDWHSQESRLKSDVIQPYTPAFGIPWVEAIAGCKVIAHPGSLWAEPAMENYQETPDLKFDLQNPWLKKMVEFTQVVIEFSDGRFPVALPQMRGPLDTLAALRKPHKMALDMIDRPVEVYHTLGELTELWIGIADTILKEVKPFMGGYSSRMKMWAPGKTVTPQNDISTLISPKMYKKMVLPWDRQIFDHFPYHSYHVHSTEYRHIDAWLEEDKLTAIQLTLEHEMGGPPLDTMIEVCRRIQAKKPLLLVALEKETADYCLDTLDPAGLCLMIGINDPVIPFEYVEWLKHRCL